MIDILQVFYLQRFLLCANFLSLIFTYQDKLTSIHKENWHGVYWKKYNKCQIAFCKRLNFCAFLRICQSHFDKESNNG